MKRWQRIGMDAEAMQTIARTTTGGFRKVEEWPPEAAQDAVRALAVMEYHLLTTMHHLQVEGTPGTDGLFTARRGAAMAVEYFFGGWREDFEYSNWADEPVEHWDAAKCRAGLAWFDAWREGLFCACVADDADALAALWRWPGADLAHDEGSWDAPQQENDFHVLLALTVREEKADERGRLHKRIKESRRQRPKLWLAGLDAIVARDPAALVAALRQMLAYNLKREFEATNPPRALLIEGSILWNVACRAGMEMPELPEDLADRIVTAEALSAGERPGGGRRKTKGAK